MSTKLKTITVYATMETELYLAVNVPESADEDEIYDFIRNEGSEGGDMKPLELMETMVKQVQNEDWGGGWWTWAEDIDMDVDFDPQARDISESFLAMMRPQKRRSNHERRIFNRTVEHTFLQDKQKR